MIEFDEVRILAFLRGECSEEEREAILSRAEESPDFAARLRSVARGFEAADAWGEAERAHSDAAPATIPAPAVPAPRKRMVPAWWVPAAAAAAIAIAVPVTATLSTAPTTGPDVVSAGGDGTSVAAPLGGMPTSPEPSFVVVLQGRWPDAETVQPQERGRRAGEYWGWANSLAAEGRLVAAGDLEWEPGIRLASSQEALRPPPDVMAEPDFLVGMFTIRAGSYEEALAIAQECPHLRYGGSVSVRRVGLGFVTVPGMDDWAGAG